MTSYHLTSFGHSLKIFFLLIIYKYIYCSDDDFKIEPAEDMKTELDNSNTFSGEIEK